MDAVRRGNPRRISATPIAMLGLFLMLPPVITVHATQPPNNYFTRSNVNCAFMSACDVTEVLMQEINALKEKMAEIVNFQVDVNQFKFEHGIYQSEIAQFRQRVELFMKSHINTQPRPAKGDNHDNEIADTTHADDPSHDLPQNDSLSLPAIHSRLDKVEKTVRQWDENALTAKKNEETLRQRLDRNEDTRKALEHKIGHLQKKMDDVQTLVKDGNVNIKAMKDDLWDIKQATNKHETALGRQQDAVYTVNQTLSTQMVELDNSVQYISSNLFQLSYRGDNFQNNITRELETVKKATYSNYSNVTVHLNQLESQMSNMNSSVRNASLEADFVINEVAEVKTQIQTIKDQNLKLDTLFAKQGNELQSVVISVRETKTAMQHHSQNMTSMTEDMENLKSEFINWEDALVVLNDSVAANNQEMVNLGQIYTANLTDMRVWLNQTDTTVAALKRSTADEVNSQKERYNDLQKRMEAAESIQKSVENEVKAYELLAGNHEREIDHLKQQNAAESVNLKALKYNVKVMQNSLHAIHRYQSELKANVTEWMQVLLPLLPTTPPFSDSNVTAIDDGTYDATTTIAAPTENVTLGEEPAIDEPLTKPGEDSSGCLFIPLSHPNIVTSIRGRPIRNTQMMEVMEGEELAHHCSDIGLFQIEGDVQRTCLKNGTWTGTQPVCHSLVIKDDFSDGVPVNASVGPAIQIHPAPESPSTGVTANGSLVVVPGSRVTFACIPRVVSAVNWTFTPSSGNTEQALSGQDTRSEAKILNARPNQSGQYTCKIINGSSHTIHVIVKDVSCASPPDDRLLHVFKPPKLRLNSRLTFACKSFGYELSYPDAKNSTLASDDVDQDDGEDFRCMASGEWSRDFPTCVHKYDRGG